MGWDEIEKDGTGQNGKGEKGMGPVGHMKERQVEHTHRKRVGGTKIKKRE